ncbi:GIN domain-containing protein [Ruania albidiflava]|uniref:GIN domain-containing protein n=1 Tax=Ruania albidiflava TaxID=366586 RepID=UPI0003B5BDF8|nr:DUF2807 domain-containing protein [Ruania albidiflava]
MALRLVLAAAAVAAGLLGLTGCGYLSAGPTDSEDRPVPSGLSEVVLEDTGSLTVTPGDPALHITAGENALKRITSAEQAGALHLTVGRGFWNSPGPIDYQLNLPELNAVTIDGAGEVTAQAVPTDSMVVRILGAGEAVITDIDAEHVTVLIEGSGSVQLRGEADRVEVHIDGAGEFHGDQLTARNAVAAIDGAGDIQVHATHALDATISGTGTIRHTGGAEVTENIDGLGEVVRG